MKSIQFPLLDRTAPNSVISTTLNDLSNWSRLSSLWPYLMKVVCTAWREIFHIFRDPPYNMG